jgi:hypothetical protein
LIKVLELILSISVLCDNKEHLINDIIMNLEEDIQGELMKIMHPIISKYDPQNQIILNQPNESNQISSSQ